MNETATEMMDLVDAGDYDAAVRTLLKIILENDMAFEVRSIELGKVARQEFADACLGISRSKRKHGLFTDPDYLARLPVEFRNLILGTVSGIAETQDPMARRADKKPIGEDAMGFIESYREPAAEAAAMIPFEAGERYTLLVDDKFCTDEQLDADINTGYLMPDGKTKVVLGDRVNVARIDTSSADLVLKAITDRGLDPNRVVVQISRSLDAAGVKRLAAAGIRVINVDANDLKYTAEDIYGTGSGMSKLIRQQCRFDIYAMMIAARRVTESDIREKTGVYRTLMFLLMTHGRPDDADFNAEDCVKALVNATARTGDPAVVDAAVGFIVTHYLSYRPTGIWAQPNFNTVAATLVSA
jgi:hypothetical protein